MLTSGLPTEWRGFSPGSSTV